MVSSVSRVRTLLLGGVIAAIAMAPWCAQAAAPKIRTVADIKAAAENGDVPSQVQIGRLYFTGLADDPRQSYEEAAKWFAKAAESGDTRAQTDIAWMYYLGAGVPRDYVAACRFLPKSAVPGSDFIGLNYFTPQHWPEDFGMVSDLYWAAVSKELEYSDSGPAQYEEGLHRDELLPDSEARIAEVTHLAEFENMNAQYLLAQLCLRGLGVPQDADRAITLLKKTADKGDDQSQVLLGLIYAEGKLVPKNLADAKEQFSKAAAKKNSWGYLSMSGYYRDDGPDHDMAKSIEWMTKAADRGNTIAMALLGSEYRHGEDVPANPEKAKALLEKAARLGSSRALGELKELDPAINKEGFQAQLAYDNLMFHADHGDLTSQFALGMINVSSEKPEEFLNAVRYLQMAADQGETTSELVLGTIYLDGKKVPKDYTKALALISQAAENGSVEAQLKLGGMYQDGLGAPKDNVKAYMWFNIAAIGVDTAMQSRDALEKVMKPEEIVQAQKLSSEWVENYNKRKDK